MCVSATVFNISAARSGFPESKVISTMYVRPTRLAESLRSNDSQGSPYRAEFCFWLHQAQQSKFRLDHAAQAAGWRAKFRVLFQTSFPYHDTCEALRL